MPILEDLEHKPAKPIVEESKTIMPNKIDDFKKTDDWQKQEEFDDSF